MLHQHKAKWFAVYTKSRVEKKVAMELEKKGVEYYLPLFKTIRQWSDRKKKVEEPLIRSYIFVRIVRREYFPVINTPGVVSVVTFSGQPVPVPDWQINNLRILLGADVMIEHEKTDFMKGQEVTITCGSLEGLRGTITHTGTKRKLVISISALNFNLTVDIDSRFVKPVE